MRAPMRHPKFEPRRASREGRHAYACNAASATSRLTFNIILLRLSRRLCCQNARLRAGLCLRRDALLHLALCCRVELELRQLLVAEHVCTEMIDELNIAIVHLGGRCNV